MMEIASFLRNIGMLVAGIALLSVLETLFPFLDPTFRKRHAAPNLVLITLTLALNFAFNAGAVLVTGWLRSRGVGLLAGARLGVLPMMLLGVFALDASTYACHRFMHALPSLWRVHSVHHSDPLVDVTTSLRFHPFETLVRFVFLIVPVWALGLSLPAVGAYRVVSAFMSLFEHANVKLWQPLDTALSLVIGTPNMHKVHHSRRATETNTNYGNILSLFDRALGTFTPSSRAASVSSGLVGLDDAETQTVGGLLCLPFRRTAGQTTQRLSRSAVAGGRATR
jgi:sterol desaturase/sphingolipid hydroxylase (fatty acid hydroxylase superfamily)